MKACDKCNAEIDAPISIHEAGAIFFQCNSCEEDYKNYLTTSVSLYVGKDHETQVSKNIREARDRRRKGVTIW